jgi:hypothetical protein
MVIGTTPTHTFTLPFDIDVIKSLKITYAQGGEVMLTKRKEDCILEGDTVTVKLSQEDTFNFIYPGDIEIQVRILTNAGDALTSYIHKVSLSKCLDDEVLV